MSLQATLNDILNAGTVSGIFNQLQSTAVAVASSIAVFTFGLNMAFNFGKKQISMLNANKVDDIKVIDFEQAVRAIIIFIMIGIYPSISGFLSSAVDGVNSMSTPKITQSEQLATNYTEIFNQMSDLEQIDQMIIIDKIRTEPGFADEYIAAGGPPEVVDIANSDEIGDALEASEGGVFDALIEAVEYMKHPSMWILDVLNALAEIIIAILRVIITIVSVYLFKFLLAIGPLAFAFSLIPVFKNQINTWFSSLLNVGLIITTINFLDHLVFEMTTKMQVKYDTEGPGTSQDWNETLAMTALYFTIIALYLSSFWLTSKFVGSGDGGKVMGKAGMVVGAAVAGVAMAGKAAASGGSAAASSGGSGGGSGGGGGAITSKSAENAMREDNES